MQMGLGKTLQYLMVILSNPAPPSFQAVSGHEYRVHEKGNASRRPAPLKPLKTTRLKTTLLIVHSTRLDPLVEEICKHVQPGMLAW